MPQLPPDSHWARRSQTPPPTEEVEADRVTGEGRGLEAPELDAGAADRSWETARVTTSAGSGRCLTFSPLAGISSFCPGEMRLGCFIFLFRAQTGRQLASLARLASLLRLSPCLTATVLRCWSFLTATILAGPRWTALTGSGLAGGANAARSE